MNGRCSWDEGRYRLELAGQDRSWRGLTGQDLAGLLWAENCAVRSSAGMKVKHDAGGRKLMRTLLATLRRAMACNWLLRVYQPGARGRSGVMLGSG